MAWDSGFSLGGGGLDFDVMSPTNYAGSFGSRDTYIPDMSFATRGVDAAPTGGGGWWDSFKDTASSFWGKSPNARGEGGSGALGYLSDFGNVAKAVMPIAQIGGGIAQFLAQRDAMDQMRRTGKVQEEAQQLALESAREAKPFAEDARAISGEIRDVASTVGPLAERAAGIAPEIRASAENVRTGIVSPVQAYAAERLARAQRGEVPPAIEAQLAQLEAGEVQKLQDYFARAGIGDSSMMQQVLGEAKARTAARRAQWLMEEEKGALAAFDQARVGEATAGSIYGQEGATLGNAANIRGSQVNDFARAAEALGIGGNILTGSGRIGGGVSEAMQREQQQIAELIAATQQALSRLTGSAS